MNQVVPAVIGGCTLYAVYICYNRKVKGRQLRSCHVTSNTDIRNVYVVPPKVCKANIKNKVECVRPVRKEVFRLFAEQVCGKYVIHNYGHGGSGWTLLFGCVDESIHMFTKIAHKHTTKYITVIGAGIMGLQTALRLVELGFSVVVVASEFDNLTSHNAGGLLAPVSMKTYPINQDIVDRTAIESFKKWDSIANGKDKRFIGCARRMPVYSSKDTDIGFDVYIANKLMKKGEPVYLHFGNNVKHMVQYNTIYIDPRKTMQCIRSELENNTKVRMEKKTIESYLDVESDVVFNCSGIGSLKLNNDKLLIPTYGHLLELKNQPEGTQDYMIFTKVKDDYVYYIPKEGGVIGGTYIEKSDYKGTQNDYFSRVEAAARSFFEQAEPIVQL